MDKNEDQTYTPLSLQNTGAAYKDSTTQPTAPDNTVLYQQEPPKNLWYWPSKFFIVILS